jgi:hypothetical protein
MISYSEACRRRRGPPLYAGRQEALAIEGVPLADTGRLLLAGCVLADGLPLRPVAERLQISPTTASRRTGRYWQVGAGSGGTPSRRRCRLS